jgi:hypothetical protein
MTGMIVKKFFWTVTVWNLWKPDNSTSNLSKRPWERIAREQNSLLDERRIRVIELDHYLARRNPTSIPLVVTKVH